MSAKRDVRKEEKEKLRSALKFFNVVIYEEEMKKPQNEETICQFKFIYSVLEARRNEIDPVLKG